MTPLLAVVVGSLTGIALSCLVIIPLMKRRGWPR